MIAFLLITKSNDYNKTFGEKKMSKTVYVIESWDLNDSDAVHNFEIVNECPRGNSGNKPEIADGWLGSYNNYTRYSKSFESDSEAKKYIAGQGAVLNEDGEYSTPETIEWENWFVDGWDYYHRECGSPKPLDEFITALNEMAKTDNDGNPMSVTDFKDDVTEWWNENVAA